VRGYLIQLGVASPTVSAVGCGKARPVATTATAAGRQLNRRVELIVSGEVIGTEVVGR
jgi:outer membrane protein OmpA-like peptidoglycan-associated protein